MQYYESHIAPYLKRDGLYHFSESKDYHISKEHYEKFLAANTNTSIKSLLQVGNHINRKLNEFQVPKNGLAVEIGCGAGSGSRRIIASNYFDDYMITDASKELALITRSSIQSYPEFSDRSIKYGVMLGEDASTFPENSVCAFFLFATLHHFVDWRSHLRSLSRILRPGGIVFCIDPCYELSTTLSLLFMSFEQIVQAQGMHLDEASITPMQAFVAASQFRGNPFAENKDSQEDKHIFRLDALYRFAQEEDLRLYVFPNSGVGNFDEDGTPPKSDFETYIRRILIVSQHFTEDLCDTFFQVMRSQLEYLKYFWDAGQGPVCNFISIFQKAKSQDRE